LTPSASGPLPRRLSRLLGKDVVLAKNCIGDDVKKLIQDMNPDSVLLLENLRFHIEESENNDDFARELAGYADVYVDDAFGNAHRVHASNVGITKFAKKMLRRSFDEKRAELFQLHTRRPFVLCCKSSVGQRCQVNWRPLRTLSEELTR